MSKLRARAKEFNWRVTSHLVALCSHVQYCSEWQNRQVGTVKTAIVSVMLTAMDIHGQDLSEPLFLFWHRHREGAWNKLAKVTLSCLSFHPKHTKPSRSPIVIAWKSLEGGARILARVVATTHYISPVILHHSRSYLNRFSLFAYHL